MKCKKCGIELVDAGDEKLCSACKEKQIKTLKIVGIAGAIGLAVVGLGYGISPVDIVPDVVPVAGLVDDAVVGGLSGLGVIGSIGLAVYYAIKEKNIPKK